MRWANPDYLWLMAVLPFMAGYMIFLRQKDLPSFRFSSIRAWGEDWGGSNAIRKELFITGIIRLLAMSLVILALARPQKGLRSEEMTTKATDIMICLDASRSMLSIDFKPKDRFQMAKSVIMDFIKGRAYDRIGLVLFAEHAITQCPLTLDRSALMNILNSLEVGVISPDQTAIGVGLVTSVNRLKNSQAKSKVIILVTDGSNNAGGIDPVTASKTAASFKIKIYAIGAASPEGGEMPVDDPLLGRRYVRIKSDLDENTLLKVSSETDGKYFRATSSQALKTIFQEIDSLEKTDIHVKQYVDYQELYIWLLIGAVGLLIFESALNKSVFRTLP